jgi:hypothetical protein
MFTVPFTPIEDSKVLPFFHWQQPIEDSEVVHIFHWKQWKHWLVLCHLRHVALSVKTKGVCP